MTTELSDALNSLSPIQKEAVDWGDGSALILAGPGAGKTRVLTTRIARIINDSPDRKFRILALTFTTKAALEMKQRVETYVPTQAEDRTFIGTFHAFCTMILRQHGSHININPDFGIFGQKEDQEALLTDAIQAAIKQGKNFSDQDVFLLGTIKELKSRLITPERSLLKKKDTHLKEVYELYENALRKENVLDFEGLIFEACRLLAKVTPIATRIQQSYPYWLIDEFQDTTPAQYWLLYYLTCKKFKNVFVVADDDQIIYQWAGASYQQIEKFRKDYDPKLIQLVQNHRCPPEIVTMANQLVGNNVQRAPEKMPTQPSRTVPLNAVDFRYFDSDEEERQTIAREISLQDGTLWGKTVILGRTRTLLEPMLNTLESMGVKANLAQRRDNFISPQFVWLQACLDQSIRPTNKRIFTILVNTANRITGLEFDPALLITEAESLGKSYFEHWADEAIPSVSPTAQKLGSLIKRLAKSRASWNKIVEEVIPILLATTKADEGSVSDAEDDYNAWVNCMKEIRSEVGYDPDLSDIMQGMALRSKEPPFEPNAVTLMTIHGSKGLEFENVYVIGLSEGEMPSWQSCGKGDTSREMEEERRNCFVAITRTQERLHISGASNYRGRERNPSRFLKEMALTN